MKISKRLQFIESLCDKTNTFCDIGTDHGYVPYLMLLHNKAKKVIASDIKTKPLEACKRNLSKFKNKNIVFRIGDGLKVIEFNEADGICICGIGYDLLRKVLTDIDLYNFKYMVLSPQTKQDEFKKYLNDKHFLYNLYEFTENKKKYYIYKVRRNYLLYLKDRFFTWK